MYLLNNQTFSLNIFNDANFTTNVLIWWVAKTPFQKQG